MKNKICMFMADFGGGGAERVMVNVANGLSKRGYGVEFVLARAVGPYRSQVNAEIRTLALSPRLSLAFPNLLRYLRESQPECILAAGEHACMLAALARWIGRAKPALILSIHGAISRPGARRAWMPLGMDERLMRFLYPKADYVVAVARGLRREAIELLHLDDSKVVTIYNPTRIEEIERLAGLSINHKWLKHDRGFSVTIFVGRLSKEKGPDILLQALPIVRKRKDVRILILGDGPDLRDLRDQARVLKISDYVDFLGYVENPFAFIAQSDTLVLPSRSEGFGNVIVEAMAVGTPVVAADCNYGPREILANGKYGVLVSPNNAPALAEGILQCLGNPHSVSDLKTRAACFSLDKALDCYEVAIRNCLPISG